MADAPIGGLCPPRFAAVRAAFEANFGSGVELGARFALAIEGEIVVDLIGGWADRAQTRPRAGLATASASPRSGPSSPRPARRTSRSRP
jgi:hypothetical protein